MQLTDLKTLPRTVRRTVHFSRERLALEDIVDIAHGTARPVLSKDPAFRSRKAVSDAEADEYFASRARGSRIASATSRQSRPLANRRQMMDEVATLTAMIGDWEASK